jgi:hypothetical protein
MAARTALNNILRGSQELAPQDDGRDSFTGYQDGGDIAESKAL